MGYVKYREDDIKIITHRMHLHQGGMLTTRKEKIHYYECKYCHLLFTSRAELISHIREAHHIVRPLIVINEKVIGSRAILQHVESARILMYGYDEEIIVGKKTLPYDGSDEIDITSILKKELAKNKSCTIVTNGTDIIVELHPLSIENNTRMKFVLDEWQKDASNGISPEAFHLKNFEEGDRVFMDGIYNYYLACTAKHYKSERYDAADTALRQFHNLPGLGRCIRKAIAFRRNWLNTLYILTAGENDVFTTYVEFLDGEPSSFDYETEETGNQLFVENRTKMVLDLVILFQKGLYPEVKSGLSELDQSDDLKDINFSDQRYLLHARIAETEGALRKLLDTSKVTTMNNMFTGCNSLTSLDVSGWDVSNVTNMHGVFNTCSSLQTVDVSKWQTGSVTYIDYMFANCSSLTTLDVSNWNTDSVTETLTMFENCRKLQEIKVGAGVTRNILSELPVQTPANIPGADGKWYALSDGKGYAPADIPGNKADTYVAVNPSPEGLLERLPEGSIVKVNENGVPVEFYVAKHNYEPDLNGAGRTLLVRKECYNKAYWDQTSGTNYSMSTIDLWLNNEYKNLFEQDVQEKIGETKFKYSTNKNGASVTSFSRGIFLLSGTELGKSAQQMNIEGSELPIASVLSVAHQNGVPTGWWTRSPLIGDINRVWLIGINGLPENSPSWDEYGIRPCFTLPSDIEVDKDGNIIVPKPQPGGPIENIQEGDTIKIKENGVPVEFYVAKHNYEPDLNGPGRTLLVRKDCYEERPWNVFNNNEYDGSLIDTWLNGEYQNLFSQEIIDVIGTTKFSYAKKTGGTFSDVVLQRPFFLLSALELNKKNINSMPEGEILPISKTLEIAYLNGKAVTQWTRTRNTSTDNAVILIGPIGQILTALCDNDACGGVRPCFTLPSDIEVDKDGNVIVPKPQPGGPIENIQEGDTIKIKENGVPVEFYVAKHNYEPDLNGPGRTLLVRKDCYDQRQWNGSDVNTYANSTIDKWLNGDYKNLFDAEVQKAIGTTKIHYTPGNRNNQLSTLERSVFLLSAYELDEGESYFNKEGTTLPNVSIYKIAKLNGSDVSQWTRTPSINETPYAIEIDYWGYPTCVSCSSKNGNRPCFTVPGNIEFDGDGNVIVPKPQPSGPIENIKEGDTVKINENGVPVEFYIAKHNYETSLNGKGRTLLVRKDCYDKRKWHSTAVNAYATSDIDSWLNSEYKSMFDSDIQKAISTTKFQYTPGNGDSQKGTLSRSIFILSAAELGYSDSSINKEGYEVPISHLIKTVHLDSFPVPQWTRSPYTNSTASVSCIDATGSTLSGASTTFDYTFRPAFTLPSNIEVDGEGNVIVPKPEPQPGESIENITEGSIVKINENGTPVEFYVAKHNYEPDLNGPGRTLLVRKDYYQIGPWNTAPSNAYANSTIDNWFNNTYKALLDEDIQTSIGTTTFYYTYAGGYHVSTLSRPVFALSGTEFGLSDKLMNVEGSHLPIADILKISSDTWGQWTRSPETEYNDWHAVWHLYQNGTANRPMCRNNSGYRPCFTLPSDIEVDKDGNVIVPKPQDGSPVGILNEGDIVEINENGVPTEFYVAKHNYEPDLNGSGRTLLVRKDCVEKVQWHSGNVNTYSGSTIDSWMNSTYKNLLSPELQDAIGSTVFYYTPGENGQVTTLQRPIFLLSMTELGFTSTVNNAEGTQLPIANTLRKAQFNGTNVAWWIRTPCVNSTDGVGWILADGRFQSLVSSNNTNTYCRPAFTLPDTFLVKPVSEAKTFNTLNFDLNGGQIARSNDLQLDLNGGEVRP